MSVSLRKHAVAKNHSATIKQYAGALGWILFILSFKPLSFKCILDYHFHFYERPVAAGLLIAIESIITFTILWNICICILCDPGFVPTRQHHASSDLNRYFDEGSEETELANPLITDPESSDSGNWCQKCTAPKFERSHHCSTCKRCVLKMDHHCPFLGQCIGYRTHPAFLRLLISIQLLSILYSVTFLQIMFGILKADITTLEDEELLMGATYVGLFYCLVGVLCTVLFSTLLSDHISLVANNQTVIESRYPSLLLRQLPVLDSKHPLPSKNDLTCMQRKLVEDANELSIYDLGWRNNWNLFFDQCLKVDAAEAGRSYPRDPNADVRLYKLAEDLMKEHRIS